MDDLLGHSITYRVAVGPRAGQKVFTLPTVPAREEEPRKGVGQYAGFSLHAGIGVEADQREKLERLTRYVSRPPVSEERLSLTTRGQPPAMSILLTRNTGRSAFTAHTARLISAAKLAVPARSLRTT